MASSAEVAAAAAVAAVLRSPDHYACIEAPHDASLAELRQCYVKASMRVHPDKNSHPDATRAFQRVAAAWQELGDEQSRWRYDQQLSMGYGGSDDIGMQGYDHMPPDAAFAAFARASAACAGNGPFGDCAESLLFANQMQFAQAQAQQPGSNPFAQPPQSLQSCGTSIAYSAGLWVAGVAATAAGFGTVGGFMRRIAVVQGCGQVVMGGLVAYQNPTIRMIIDAQTAKVSERATPVKLALANASAAVRSRVEDIAASELVEQLGSVLPHPCIPHRRLGAPEADKKIDAKSLRAGSRITLAGLQATAELNGRLCEVVRYDSKRERYVVRVLPIGVRVSLSGSSGEQDEGGTSGSAGRAADDLKLVKLDNLRPAPPIPSHRAPKTLTQFM